MALQPDDTLLNGQYRILRQLGRGGFGFVYHAQDTHLGEEVAVKELIPALVGDEAILKRFLAEAKATMRFAHEHIVRTHHVFAEHDNYYIVMEYMAGGSLEERLQAQGLLPMEEAIGVAAGVCEGLSYAHQRGVVHCDLKPANILFTAAGMAKVADFGIAHVSGEMLTRSWHTPAGFVAGTLPYMSPEQADGVRDEPRLDVYALGAVLYRTLTGRTYLDFSRRETPGAQADNVLRIRTWQPDPPSTHRHQIPLWLDQVVLKALAKQPDGRYSTATELRSALLARGQEATGLAVSRERVGTPLAPPRERRLLLPRRLWPVVGIAAALLVVLVIATSVLVAGRDRNRATSVPTDTSAAMVQATSISPPVSPSQTQQVTPTDTPVAPSTLTPAPTGTVTLVPTNTPPPPTDTPTSSSIPPPTRTPVLAARLPNAGDTWTRPADGQEMVYVPAGDFVMGSTEAQSSLDNEKPPHTVFVDAFWIDRTEVTNAQYRRCVESGVCQAPTCDTGYGDPSRRNEPVACVSWHDAQAYAAWVGGRLPTEAGWEKAARGTDRRIHPWGDDEPDCNIVNYMHCVGHPVAVGSYPAGASPYGALDMAGNVHEWVADWYANDYYAGSPARNPQGPDSGTTRVCRGGAFDGGQAQVRSTFRNGNNPGAGFSTIGFRVAMDTTAVP